MPKVFTNSKGYIFIIKENNGIYYQDITYFGMNIYYKQDFTYLFD